MILIADSGATKIEWCLIDGESVVTRFNTIGMNVMMLSDDEFVEQLTAEVVPNIAEWLPLIDSVYYYGAGCVSPQVCDGVAAAIGRCIPAPKIEVATDLLGTCRALCADRPGLVCILGTGSNSCFYDGKSIVENISPLGFILGDEGSGAYLGKILVGDVLKRALPADVCKMFLDETGLDAVTIVQNVYRKPHPNRFLASLTPFLSKHIEHPAVRSLVIRAFKAFFERNVCLYTDRANYKVYCCGSIGYVFKDLLAEAAAWYGFSLGTILKAPMDGLIKYHAAPSL